MKALAVAVALVAVLQSSAEYAHASDAGIELLRHPYPYKASLTIVSDLHRTSVEDFEAVHGYINGEGPITPESPEWGRLGFDRWAAAQGRTSIPRLGFPFGDSFLFFDSEFGWFKGFDPVTGSLIPHERGLTERFGRWYDRGYLDPLHTFGSGDVQRPAATAATEFLLARGGRAPNAWLNHSKAVTPSGVADACCSVLNQVLVSSRYHVSAAFGNRGNLATPARSPGAGLLVGMVVFWLAVAIGVLGVRHGWLGRGRTAAGHFALSILMLGALQVAKVDFYLGDNPGSRFYNLDQIRRLGVRYFWTVNSDYWASTTTDVVLPEDALPQGRTTIFRPHHFNDGSSGLGFSRNTIDGTDRTLDLLSRDNLDRLVSTSGRTIIYWHWLYEPQRYFTALGVERFETLASFANRHLIWTATASEFLDQAYAYSYVRYTAEHRGRVGVVAIAGFDDPIGGALPATLDRVRNLSFRCRDCDDLVLTVSGVPVPSNRVVVAHDDGATTVTITGAVVGQPAATARPTG